MRNQMIAWDRPTADSEPEAISRRAFGAKAAMVGGGAALSVSGFGARAATAPEPAKKGGLLRLGLAGGGEKDSFDPAVFADSAMVVAARGVFSGLVEWGADGRPAPELATSWSADNGATQWTFNLRKGVRFSNGQEFTADDAIYSLNLRRGDALSDLAFALKAIKEIKKLDKNQIQIALDAPDADFPTVLTDRRLPMVPDGFNDWSKPVGAGAFVLDKFEPGVRIALKKAGDYWKDGRGHLDAAEINVIGDWPERLNALISGQVDIVNRVDHRTAGLVAKAAKTEIVRATSGWHAVLAMQVDVAPYDNPDIRLALKYAVDREQMLKNLLGNYGAFGNDHPISYGDPYFNRELPQTKHDPDRAAFHLKKSGLDPAIVLQASVAAFDGAVDAGALFQSNASRAGFKITLKEEPAEGYWDNVWMKGAFVESYWNGRPAATQMLSDAYRAGAPRNETHWKNDKFEKLLADAKSETDEAKRKSFIWAMQTIVHDEGGAIIPLFRDWIDAHHDSVGGHTPHGGSELDNGYILEKAFFKA
jgi:peptide/nickel transport system substrate-binding protein